MGSEDDEGSGPVQLHKLVCGACERPITRGQAYAEVRMPDGTRATVHGTCLRNPVKAKQKAKRPEGDSGA